MSSLIKFENVSLNFGGVNALTEVSFEVPENSLFSIIGPNGAGKTSIFNCISGIYRPTSGTVKILNKDIWEDLEVADFSAIYSVTNNLNKTTIIEEDDIFLVISPGNEISIKSLTLSGGKNVEL